LSVSAWSFAAATEDGGAKETMSHPKIVSVCFFMIDLHNGEQMWDIVTLAPELDLFSDSGDTAAFSTMRSIRGCIPPPCTSRRELYRLSHRKMKSRMVGGLNQAETLPLR
jgi:hypothetical protein